MEAMEMKEIEAAVEGILFASGAYLALANEFLKKNT